MKRWNYGNLLILIFSVIPLIDSLNGFLLLNKINLGISLGQSFRTIVMLLLIIILIKEGYLRYLKKNKIIICGVSLFTLIFIIQLISRKLGFAYNLKITLKLANIFLIIETFKFMKFRNLINVNIIDKIFINLSMIMPLTLIIPYFLKMGKSVYSTGAGYKGFYFANNDLSIVLLVLFIYSLHKVIVSKKNIYKINLFLVFISNFFIGSKTNMMGIILVIGIYGILNIKLVKEKIKFNKKTIFIGSGILIVLIILTGKQLSSGIARQIYYFKELDLITYIFSSRNRFLIEAFNNNFNSHNWILNIIFGNGFYNIQNYWSLGKLTELDFFDTFFAYGLVGAGFVYYYLTNIFFKALKNIKKSNYQYYIAYIIIMGFSFVAGHVLYSALSGSIFALVCSALIMEEKNVFNKNIFRKVKR